MPDRAYVNGSYSALEEATVSINDRGLLFGDSIYESIRTYGGRPFLLDEHRKRLERNCEYLRLNAAETIRVLPDVLATLGQECGYDEILFYVQITRGTEPRNHVINGDTHPTLIVTARELKIDAERAEQRAKGVRIGLRLDTRGSLCEIKTTNLLGNVLAKSDAAKHGCFEAALVKSNGTVTEGCSSTVFLVKDSRIHTHPLDGTVLDGVTRRFVLAQIAPQCGLEIEERAFTQEELRNADEIFLSATTYMIMPVTQVEDTTIGSGTPGPVTKQLINAAFAKIRA